MNTIAFYLCALVLCHYAFTMIKESSRYALSENHTSAKSATRRALGRLLIVTAAVSAGMGLLDQFVSIHR